MNRRLTWLIVSMVFGFVSAATSSVLTLGDLKATGSGTFDTNCLHTLSSGCQITGTGQMTGAPVNPGGFALRLDTGSPGWFNGYGTTTLQGVCFPAAFQGSLAETAGDTIEFNHVGMVCEEGAQGSPFHYNGTYRITGGTGRFASAAGSGTVTAAFTRQDTFEAGSGDVLFYLNGTIAY